MSSFFRKKKISGLKANSQVVEMTPVLEVLDNCAEAFTFPILDNGYVYLAASKLTAYHADEDWALVIEIFGFSPRAGDPDLAIHTFGSKLRNRKTKDDYFSEQAYENYLKNNQFNAYKSFFPFDGGSWVNPEDNETAIPKGSVNLRGKTYELPNTANYEQQGITLENENPWVHELCRYISSVNRDAVLATNVERRYNVPIHLEEVLSLDDWFHPDLVDGQKPSEVESFQQISKVLETGDASQYKPTLKGNTYWKNWPDGGTL